MVRTLFVVLLTAGQFWAGCQTKTPFTVGGDGYVRLDIAWEIDMDEVFHTPLLDDGVVYFITHTQKAYALDADNGHVVWSDSIYGRPVFNPGLIDDEKYLYFPIVWGGASCLNKRTGEQVWWVRSDNTNHLRIMQHQGWLYLTGTGEENILVVDKSTGVKIWHFKAGGRVWTTPVIVDDYVYFATDDPETVPVSKAVARFYCLNKETGAKVFEVTYGSEGLGGMVADMVVYEDLAIVTQDSTVYALNRFDGSLVWQATMPSDPFDGGNAITGPMQLDGDRIYAGTVWGGMICIDIPGKRIAWYSPFNESRADEDPLLITQDKVFGLYAGGEIIAVDKQTGKEVWTAVTELVSARITPGRIYGFRDGGTFVCYKFPL